MALIAGGAVTVFALFAARPRPPSEPPPRAFEGAALVKDPTAAHVRGAVLVPPGAGDDTTYFLGEIINDGKEPMATPLATVKLLDERGAAIAELPCASPVRALAPGERVGCSLRFAEAPRGARTSYAFAPRDVDPRAKLVAVRTSPVVYTPPSPEDFAAVDARLFNDGARALEDVAYSVSLYDAKGEVVGVVEGRVPRIEPGASAAIHDEVTFLNGAPARRSIHAEGLQ